MRSYSIAFIILCFCCSEKKSIGKQIERSTEQQTKKLEISEDIISDSISFMGYTMRVVDNPVIDVIEKDKVNFGYKNLMQNQKLIFTKDGNEISTVILPISTVKVSRENGDKITVWDQRIAEISIVQGSKDFCFTVYGLLGYNGGAEFFAYLSKEGEIIYFTLGKTKNELALKIGTFEQLEEKIGVKQNMWDDQQKNSVEVVDYSEFLGL